MLNKFSMDVTHVSVKQAASHIDFYRLQDTGLSEDEQNVVENTLSNFERDIPKTIKAINVNIAANRAFDYNLIYDIALMVVLQELRTYKVRKAINELIVKWNQALLNSVFEVTNPEYIGRTVIKANTDKDAARFALMLVDDIVPHRIKHVVEHYAWRSS